MEEVVGGAEVVVGGGEEVVVGAGGGQDSDSLVTPAGRLNDEIGAPTGSENVSVEPVISVTVTVQSSARAGGSAAIPITASVSAATSAPIASFRLLSKVAFLLPPCASGYGSSSAPRPQGGVRGKLLAEMPVCNGEP